MKRSLRITVGGKVQNVGLRERIKNVAEELRVEGTAENADDGSVLIYVSGESEKLDSLIDAIYEGTQQSSIEFVDVESNTTPRNFRGVFRVIGEDE
jgi:acylphosphatase